jgi:hypothetical protein
VWEVPVVVMRTVRRVGGAMRRVGGDGHGGDNLGHFLIYFGTNVLCKLIVEMP